MPVTSSSFELGVVQRDGSRHCIERHLTERGERTLSYHAPDGFDWMTRMQARVAEVDAALADEEANENSENDGAPSTVNLTLAQYLIRVRQAYASAERADACRIAWWLLRRIAAGHVTDTQCRVAFGGLTITQWNNVKTNRLTPQSNAWAAVLAAAGE